MFSLGPMLRSLITASLLLQLCCVLFGCAKSWKRADVFLLEWQVETYTAVRADHLRNWATPDSPTDFHSVAISDQEQVDQLVRHLDLARLHRAERRREDARLLVDLYDLAGRRTSYLR